MAVAYRPLSIDTEQYLLPPQRTSGGDLAHVEEIDAHVSGLGSLTSRCGRCRLASDISMYTNIALAFGALELWIDTSSSRFAQNMHGITYT